MRQRSSVSSLLIYSTWPGPPPDVIIRQKLALVLNAAPSVSLRRMNGFSPVRMTRFGSAIGMVVSSSSGVCSQDQLGGNGSQGHPEPPSGGAFGGVRPHSRDHLCSHRGYASTLDLFSAT